VLSILTIIVFNINEKVARVQLSTGY